MNRPVIRYRSSRRFLLLALAAIAGGAFSVWTGLRWSHRVFLGPAWLAQIWSVLPWIAAVGFVLSAAVILALVLRPAIQIHEAHLQIGRRVISWPDIRRVDQTGWTVPLVLQLTLEPKARHGPTLLLFYAGDLDSCGSLLRNLRRYSRHALLDGVPYREFWGEHTLAPGVTPKQLPPPRYRLLRPEDEDEVERMFQRLKTAGTIDKTSVDD